MLLKVGSKGEDVKKLQSKLGIGTDGVFGPGTERAVKKWQIDHDLTADGIVGDGTWSKMFTSIVITEDKVITPVAPVSASIPNSNFKLDKLRGHIPDSVIAQIPDTAAKFGITTPLRLSHFLAQCGHESAGFKAVQENLNYSAKGLMGIFKKYFPSQTLAEQYQRNPQKIASKVYGGRMGNGPEPTQEGYKFRGRGYIQLTGKENYTAFGKSINEDIAANPTWVAEKYALLSAAWFFNKNKLHTMADGGATDAVVTSITKRVNGGTIGLPDRIKHFKEYYALLA
jgi:putative chitinase